MRIIKKILPWIIGVLGGTNAKDIFSGLQTSKTEIINFLNGSLKFFDMNSNSQFFLISMSILIVIVIIYVVLIKLFDLWNCNLVLKAKEA
jgi:hypothetical protein